MKKLRSKQTGVVFGYDEEMALNTNDYEVIVDRPAPRKRARPKAKAKDTAPVQTEIKLDGLLDGLDDS